MENENEVNMHIQVLQWNISYMSKANSIASYLQTVLANEDIPTIICLQEVMEKTYLHLTELFVPSFRCYSLNQRQRGNNEGMNRALGVAVIGFNLSLESCSLVERSVFPERTLDVICWYSDKRIRVLSFHSLTGVGYKNAKSSNFASIADHLELNPDIDFLCFDANEGKTDSLYLEKREFYDNGDKGQKAALIMGASPVHKLQDSLLAHLQAVGMIEDSNPLAVSFMTRKTPRRYDYIYSSTEWHVDRVEYRYEEALKATSDHAIVVGNFWRE